MAKSSTLPPPAWPPIFLLVDLFMHIKKYLNIVLGIQGGFFSLAIIGFSVTFVSFLLTVL